MTAYGYVRKSVMADDSQTLSPKVQEERLRALASAHADDDPVILRDLDISGAKVEERRGYIELVRAIEDGEAHAIYAYDLSRLHRNTEEALRFFRLAREHDVTVRLVAESIDTSGPTGELMLTILAAMNAWVSRVTSVKIKASLAKRFEETGLRNGGLPYANPDVVVAAVHEAGSYTGAARLLNERRVPTRNSKGVWHATSVRSIVKRVAPDEIAPSAGRGARVGPRDARLARLLRCSVCGSLLTPSYDRRTGHMRYYCHAGSVIGHGRKTVPETKLLPAFETEMERARTIVRRLQRGDSRDEAKRAELEARAERLSRQHEMGLIDDVTLATRAGQIREELGNLRTRQVVKGITLPVGIDDDPRKVNAYLARLLDHVTVDMSGAEGRGGAPELNFVWRDSSMRMDHVDQDADTWAEEEWARMTPEERAAFDKGETA